MKKKESSLLVTLKAVDEVVLSIDKDRTVCDTIRHISEKFGKDYDLAFANGGVKQQNHPRGPV